MARTLQVYESPEITVTFEPALCIHSARCVRGLPAVFDVRRRHWVTVEAASAEEIHAQIAKCPSGALKSYRPGEFVPPADDGKVSELPSSRASELPSSRASELPNSRASE
jgi:uncharacterized Fe-S cluster protein YjdI